jgi:hypothetical protein
MTDSETSAILAAAKTIAIVGLSDKPDRESYQVADYLQRHGYRIIPVNPAVLEVLGERSYPSLIEVPETIDVVDVFRRAEAVPAIVDEAIAIGAKTIWLQLGIVNKEAEEKARAAGLQFVADRCMKIEHGRLRL